MTSSHTTITSTCCDQNNNPNPLRTAIDQNVFGFLQILHLSIVSIALIATKIDKIHFASSNEIGKNENSLLFAIDKTLTNFR